MSAPAYSASSVGFGANPTCDNHPYARVLDDGTHDRQVAHISSFPGPRKPVPAMLDGTTVDVSQSISHLTWELRRLLEREDIAAHWRDMYDRVCEGYRLLDARYQEISAINVDMSTEMGRKDRMMQEKDDTIAILQAESHKLAAQVASYRLTELVRRGEDGLASLPAVDASDWIGSFSVSNSGEEESKTAT
ncbi:hypothetical protein GE09DRAFT_1161638 [Coniochaeta sp. 2T2.1]|nr:hypothetical protein GE09DRAFT_1161638 [Coniochaeta sp. 2T2.1]